MLPKDKRNRPKGKKEKTPWEPSPRQMEIYGMVCEGHSQRKVGRRYDMTGVNVHYIVRKIDGWLAPMLMDKIREIKANHTQSLMYIFTQAMRAWRRSMTHEVVRTTTEKGSGQFPGTDEQRRRRQLCGNPAYLAEARAALADIRKIWGADAPLEIKHTGEVRVAGRDVSECRDELLERMQTLANSRSAN